MKTEITTGLYSITLEGDILPEKVMELAEAGLVQGQIYRGVLQPLREETGAKRKLEDCKAFDAAVGKKVQEEIEKTVKPFGKFTVVVGEYVPGDRASADTKFTEEREIVGRHESAGDLESWLKTTIGYSGPSHTEDEEDYAVEALRAVRAFKIAYLAKQRQSL